MEPITTAAVATIVSYLAGKAFDKAFDTTTEEFTKDSISWLKSVFFREDGKPKKKLEKLQKDPQDELNHESAALAIRKRVRDDPRAEKWVQEIAEVIESKKARGEQVITISHSKNVNTGHIQAGRDNIIGDNNR